ncbi:MAG: DNA repair protein RecO [Turicibacter sp.]
MAVTVEGIILKNFNYGENHKILKVITKELGMIGIFVQNANKVNTKNSALVQPLTCAHFNLKSSSNSQGELYYLSSGDIVDHYMMIKMDYEILTYFYLMIEIILKGLGESEHSAYVYRLLKKCLTHGNEGYNPFLLSLIFQFKMLPVLGIMPVLDCCTNCQSTQNIVTMSITQGGLLCANCMDPQESIVIDATLIPFMRALYRIDMNDLPEIEMDKELFKPIETFLNAYYDAYAGFTLASKKFLRDL